MITTLATLLHNTTRTVQNWKKEKRPIIDFLEFYFSKEELNEFLKTGKIEKLDIINKFSKEELRNKLFNTSSEDLLIDYLTYNINLKKPGILNSSIPAYLQLFKIMNEEFGNQLTAVNAKNKVMEYILNQPTSFFNGIFNDKLNPTSQKQLIKDLTIYYSSVELYVLVSKNLDLKK